MIQQVAPTTDNRIAATIGLIINNVNPITQITSKPEVNTKSARVRLAVARAFTVILSMISLLFREVGVIYL